MKKTGTTAAVYWAVKHGGDAWPKQQFPRTALPVITLFVWRKEPY